MLGGWGLGSLTRLQPRFGPGLPSPAGLTGTDGSLPKTVTQLAFDRRPQSPTIRGSLHRQLECPRNMAAYRANGRGWGLCLSWLSLNRAHTAFLQHPVHEGLVSKPSPHVRGEESGCIFGGSVVKESEKILERHYPARQ